MDRDRTRRGFLAACGVTLAAGAAGCSGGFLGSSDPSTEPPADPNGTDEPVAPVDPAADSGSRNDVSSADLTRVEADSPYADVYRSTIDSVGQIRLYGDNGTTSGTGFVFDDEHVVTNQHVVESADEIYLRFTEGGWIDASVAGTDVYSDLAVLSVSGLPRSASALTLRDTDPAIGTEVVAIGNPYGFSGSVSSGIVSGVNRALPGPNDFSIPDAIQTDAPVNPGNSGGPLVTLDGRVAGVINSGGGDNIGFAISSALTNRVVPALIEDGEFEHSYMGVRISNVGPLLAEANDIERGWGVYVAIVPDGGPSDGVLQGSTGQTTINGRTVRTGGDVIVELGDTPIPTNNALASYLALETSPGDTIPVTVVRDGRERTVDLTLGSRENASI